MNILMTIINKTCLKNFRLPLLDYHYTLSLHIQISIIQLNQSAFILFLTGSLLFHVDAIKCIHGQLLARSDNSSKIILGKVLDSRKCSYDMSHIH